MKYSLLIALFVLAFSASCQKKTVNPDQMSTSTSPNSNKQKTYLALGDSYTIGESVATDLRYPSLIVSSLQKENIKVVETIIARTGWTTANLKEAIDDAGIDTKTYDIVSLLIGVNNQFQERSLSEYKIEFKELLQTALKFAKNNKDNVFVISIPDYGYTPYGEGNEPAISKEIDLFNAANKKITDSMGLKYFDITTISRHGLQKPELVAGDGLHPSGVQYQQWVDLMIDHVKNIASK